MKFNLKTLRENILFMNNSHETFFGRVTNYILYIYKLRLEYSNNGLKKSRKYKYIDIKFWGKTILNINF